ncbi:MAG: hypothetical protein AAGA93_05100 [Actinomycetota bacterium]
MGATRKAALLAVAGVLAAACAGGGEGVGSDEDAIAGQVGDGQVAEAPVAASSDAAAPQIAATGADGEPLAVAVGGDAQTDGSATATDGAAAPVAGQAAATDDQSNAAPAAGAPAAAPASQDDAASTPPASSGSGAPVIEVTVDPDEAAANQASGSGSGASGSGSNSGAANPPSGGNSSDDRQTTTSSPFRSTKSPDSTVTIRPTIRPQTTTTTRASTTTRATTTQRQTTTTRRSTTQRQTTTQPPTTQRRTTTTQRQTTTRPPTTQRQTTTTVRPPTTSPPTTSGNRVGDLAFREDFTAGNWQGRFDFDVFHRDDVLGSQDVWPGDHQITGPNDLCGPPQEKRSVNRGQRSSGFNDEWIYRCVPGGDLAKAHIMTTIGNTSGYSVGGFAPKETFRNVREVRWDVNQTDLGTRQWTEIAIVPVAKYDILDLPCPPSLPCQLPSHTDLGSVGTRWMGQHVRGIGTPSQPNGYIETTGPNGYRCGGCPMEIGRKYGVNYAVNDPAITSIQIRRTNFFRDNGDGTLTWGLQMADGSFDEFTVPGSIPSGPVKVVFKDHNYTPLKAPSKALPVTTFTWHWDNLEVYTR